LEETAKWREGEAARGALGEVGGVDDEVVVEVDHSVAVHVAEVGVLDQNASVGLGDDAEGGVVGEDGGG
jgi:hypothetical protein